MVTITEIRQQYPQYTDMSDDDLAGALHKKFYADMPREDFNQRIGLSVQGGGQFADTLGENFRVSREGMSEPAPEPASLMRSITGIPQEAYNTTAEALSGVGRHLNPFSAERRAGYERGESGILSTGKGLASALSAPFAPFVGAGRSLIGNPLAVADDALREGAASLYGDENVPPALGYEGVKGVADQAISAIMPRGFSPAGPLPQSAARITPPTVQELKTAARAGYQSPEVKGLEIKLKAVTDWVQTTKTTLNAEGFDDIVAKSTFDILGKLEKAPPGMTITGQNLNSVRKTLGNVAREVGPTGTPTSNAAAASKAIESLDDLIPNIAPADVLAGNPAAAQGKLDWARGNYSAAMQSGKIDKKLVDAELRSSASNSGMNTANTVRQRLATMLNDPKQAAGLTTQEKQIAEKIVRGSYTGNTLRFAGNLLGGGGGLGAVAAGAAGAMATGGPGIVAPAVGFALKAISNRMTVNQAQKLSETIRSRAPLANAAAAFGAKAQAFQATPSPSSFAGAMLSARNLSTNLKDAGIIMSPADILKSLQGPVRSAAEDDQPQ